MYYYFFINRYFVSFENQKLCENVKFILRVIRDCLSRCMSTSRNFFVALYEFAFYESVLYGTPLYIIHLIVNVNAHLQETTSVCIPFFFRTTVPCIQHAQADFPVVV